jgi:NAD(P)-dependent dehydrogenase (short-subunit alcohol dehydrogenase family)
MSSWLAGKRAQLIGVSDAVRAAVVAAGAVVTDHDDADVLLQGTAAASPRPAHLMDHAEWRAALDAGLDQRFHAITAFATQCRTHHRPGSILLVGAPEQGGGTAQAAAAGALGNLVKTLGVEWARDGIRINALLTISDGPAVGRFTAYLASDYAAYVTGMVTGWGLDDG